VTLVVDASVACKWFVADIDTGAAEALVTGGHMLLAPDLIVPELCNVAWLKLRRGEITAEQAMADGLPDLLDELLPSVQLASRALEIAMTVSHPAYGASLSHNDTTIRQRKDASATPVTACTARPPWVRGGAATIPRQRTGSADRPFPIAPHTCRNRARYKSALDSLSRTAILNALG
jgi:predicted nucleic acid-binding protein